MPLNSICRPLLKLSSHICNLSPATLAAQWFPTYSYGLEPSLDMPSESVAYLTNIIKNELHFVTTDPDFDKAPKFDIAVDARMASIGALSAYLIANSLWATDDLNREAVIAQFNPPVEIMEFIQSGPSPFNIYCVLIQLLA